VSLMLSCDEYIRRKHDADGCGTLQGKSASDLSPRHITDVAFICYSAKSTLEEVQKSIPLWAHLVHTHAGTSCVILLVITKTDLIPPDDVTTRITEAETLQGQIESPRLVRGCRRVPSNVQRQA
jgi:hypothetical protein